MSLIEFLDRHPLAVAVGLVVVSASSAIGVSEFFHQQQKELDERKHAAQIRDLTSELASVRRGIGTRESFDVRTLLFEGDEPGSVPDGVEFFSQDNFYADRDLPGWSYSVTTEIDLVSSLTGLEKSDLPAGLTTAAQAVPVHLWRAAEEYKVENNKPFTKLFSFVAVQVLPIDSFKDILGVTLTDPELQQYFDPTAIADKIDTASDPENKETESPGAADMAELTRFTEHFDRLFRGDIIGFFLTMQLQLQLMSALNTDDAHFTLGNIQKVGNVLYAQTRITLLGATVQSQRYDRYFISREMFLVSNPHRLYVVQTFIPSPDPSIRNPAFARVTLWLNRLRIGAG